MSDIKKTALVILIIALLSNTFTQYAYAADDYNHSELLEYEGYGEAMYESIVEQTTFISGQYTNNKDYVSESIDQIIDYANVWKDDFNNWDKACNNDFTGCMRGMLESGIGYGLTVGDWMKNLFNDYDLQAEEIEGEMDFGAYESYFIVRNGFLHMADGYLGQVKASTGTYTMGYIDAQINGSYDYSPFYNRRTIRLSSNTIYSEQNVHYATKTEARDFFNDYLAKRQSVNGYLNILNSVGISISVIKDGNEIIPPRNTVSRDMNNYIRDNPIQVVTPKLKPELVCPDGTRIQMGINGSTFIAVNGETMIVNKDGTAEVNGVICNLNWQKPNVEYTPDGKVKVDDEISDDNPPDFTDLEGCNGAIMCGIAKMLDGLGSVVNAITGLVGKILDGLLGLFVPEDLDFMTEEFNKITNKLNEKIAITETLKKAITGVFDGGGSNPLTDISINLPITNEPLTFGNVSFIEEGVPILRRVISAIVVLYTIAYVYRKITGRGGVMER